ncbi:hypothetical protein R5R35_004421 [Gryllus longicercus]|uniref:Uncharacterized protein n=1 Tax=Gryllus longicercus TaxID=2509291 RepID=A0AAN9Z1K3_9ORTH
MVRHTFSSGVFFGPNRRSLRSDKATYVSGTQMNSDSNNWKNSLPSARRASLPPFSNGHHLRSGKLLEKATKTTGQNDSMEQVQCNGVNPSHCYDTRYGSRNAEQNNQKFSPRKTNHWDGPLGGRPKRTRTTSASFLNLSETDQLSRTVSDLGPKLRSRHVWFPNNLIALSSDVDDGSKHSCTTQYEALPLGKGVQDYKDDFNTTLTGSDLNIKEDKVYKHSDPKHCHQMVKRKRLTAEEKLIEDNKAYYKLEVKNSKLRSSGYYIHQRESSASVVDKEPKVTELEIPKETVITCNGDQTECASVKNIGNEKSCSVVEVKRNKIRLSELSLLNNEAENFMFGELTKNDEYSSDDSDYEDNKNNLGNNSICCEDSVGEDSKNNNGDDLVINKCKSSSELKIGNKEKNLNYSNKETSLNISQKFDHCSQNNIPQFDCEVSFQQKGEKHFLNDSEYEENMLEYCSLTNSECNSVDNFQRRHRKRALSESHAHGNVASYKSEVSDVQSYIHVRASPHMSVKMQNKLENENGNDGVVRTNSYSNPCTSENINASLQSSNCDKLELKPSCLPKVGSEDKDDKMKPSDKYPNVKNEAVTGLYFSFEGIPESEPWFQTYQRQDEGEEFYLSTVNDCTYWKSFLLPYEMPPEHFNTLSNNVGVPKTTKVTTIKRRKRKNNANLLDKKPRKSPRCHASTLAILSSLMHHRKRRESEKISDDNLPRNAEEDPTNSSLASNANSNQQRGINDLAQNADQLLGLYSEIGVSSESHAVSTADASEEVNHGRSHKIKGLKYKRPHKSIHTGSTKKSETDINMKSHDVIDVDPVVLEELAVSGENSFSCVDDLSIRNRGGPYMDVISLLNGYGNCCCVEGLMKCRDMSRYDDVHPSRETCNSSECASSTGETAHYSDMIRVRGKKRKRKKNMTGWPVEKQKLKRRLLLKLARPELQATVSEVKEKDERLVMNEESISTSGPNDSKCLPCVEVQGVNDELAKQSETSGTIDRSRNSINEVASENTCKKTINSRCIDVDTDSEMKASVSEQIDHGETSTVATPTRTADKLCMSRTASVDSNSQHCDFQPRVRVKKMNSVDDLNFVLKNSGSASSVNNTRQLRSASFSSSVTLRKNSFHYDSVDTMEVVRRASGRMKKSCSRWDSWSTRRRR